MFLGCTLTLLLYMCPQLWRYLCSSYKLDPVSSESGLQWNGAEIQQNEPGFHWIVTEGTCISGCKYKCVYINRLLQSVSVIVPFKVHTSLFGSNFPWYNNCSPISYLSNCIGIIPFGVVFMWENGKRLKKVTYCNDIWLLLLLAWH